MPNALHKFSHYNEDRLLNWDVQLTNSVTLIAHIEKKAKLNGKYENLYENPRNKVAKHRSLGQTYVLSIGD